MDKISVKDIRDDIAEIVNRAAYGKERIIVTRHGKNVAAIVPVEDIETMEYLEDQFDLAEVQRILKEGGPDLPWEDVKARLGLAGKKNTRAKRTPARKK